MTLAILLYVEELCRYFIDLSTGHINPISLDSGGKMLISLNQLRSHCSNLLNPTNINNSSNLLHGGVAQNLHSRSLKWHWQGIYKISFQNLIGLDTKQEPYLTANLINPEFKAVALEKQVQASTRCELINAVHRGTQQFELTEAVGLSRRMPRNGKGLGRK